MKSARKKKAASRREAASSILGDALRLLLRFGRRFFNDFSRGVDSFTSRVNHFASRIDGRVDRSAGVFHDFARRGGRVFNRFASRGGGVFNRRRFRRGFFFRTSRQSARGERNSQQNQPLLAHDPCTPASAADEFGSGIGGLLSDFALWVKALARLSLRKAGRISAFGDLRERNRGPAA